MSLLLLSLRVFLYVGLKLRDSRTGVSILCLHSMDLFLLFWGNHFPLYCLLVVWSSTGWTQTIHVRLDIVEAKLADLEHHVRHRCRRNMLQKAHLVSARAWSEVLI